MNILMTLIRIFGHKSKIVKGLFYLIRMENNPFRHAKKLEPPLDRLYRVRIGEDRVLFSIRGREEIYLEYMDDRKEIYKKARRMETKAKIME